MAYCRYDNSDEQWYVCGSRMGSSRSRPFCGRHCTQETYLFVGVVLRGRRTARRERRPTNRSGFLFVKNEDILVKRKNVYPLPQGETCSDAPRSHLLELGCSDCREDRKVFYREIAMLFRALGWYRQFCSGTEKGRSFFSEAMEIAAHLTEECLALLGKRNPEAHKLFLKIKEPSLR